MARTLRVLDELRGFRRGRRLSDLAREAGASERTVRRDLTDLRSVTRAATVEIAAQPDPALQELPTESAMRIAIQP